MIDQDEDEVNVVKRKELQSTLVKVNDFLGSYIHKLFVDTTQIQLDEVTEILLDSETRDHAYIMELKGQRFVLSSNLSLFEDAAQTLEKRIEAFLNSENQTEPSTNQDYE